MTRPLRVLLVADAVGGVWDYALTLAGGLLCAQMRGEGDARVLLVALGPPPSQRRLAAARAIPHLDVRVLSGHLDWMAGGREWLAPLRKETAALAVEWQADVIHVNQLGLAGVAGEPAFRHMARRPPVVLGVHSDVMTWWLWVKDGGVPPCSLPDYLRWQRDLAWQALRLPDAVVCPSAFLAGEVVKSYGLDAQPSVIHNAAGALLAVCPAVARERNLAIVVGRVWDEAKNVALVAEALRACRRPWRVEVAGEVTEPAWGPAPLPLPLPLPLPAAPGLRYLGFLDKEQLAHLFARASVCLAPSRYEPFGLAATEAALAGCALVANDLPSYREVWSGAARYFRRNEACDLARVLDRLYDDPVEVGRLAKAAHDRVGERYTVARMAGAYLDLYHRLAQPGGQAGGIVGSKEGS